MTPPIGSTTVDPPLGSRTRVNPFPGPRAYRRNDEEYFFGRSEEVDELTALVLSSSATLLYAPSGVSIHPLKGGRDHRWAGWPSGAGGAGTWSGGCG